MKINHWTKDFFLAFVWGYSFILVSMLIFYFLNHNFQWINFLQFDAVHYYKIVHLGYDHKRSAFFPFFPWIWRVLGGNISIGIVTNILIFSFSFAILNQIFQWDYWQKILFLSIPSSIFYFLPYSESIFALSSILLLYAIIHKKNYLIILSFFLISLSRPAFSVLLPSLIVYLFFSKYSLLTKIKIFSLSLVASIIVLWIINAYQYSQTHIGWGFYSAQTTYWDNQWRLPRFPLSSYGDIHIFRLDLTAFSLGLISIILLIQQLRNKIYQKKCIDDPHIIVYSYIAIISLLVLFTRGGSLFSLNRLVFATIFGGIFIVQLPQIFKKQYFPVIIVIFLIILNGYSHIRYILNLLPILIPFIFIYYYEKKWAKMGWILLMIGLQLFLMQKFMLGNWVA